MNRVPLRTAPVLLRVLVPLAVVGMLLHGAVVLLGLTPRALGLVGPVALAATGVVLVLDLGGAARWSAARATGNPHALMDLTDDVRGRPFGQRLIGLVMLLIGFSSGALAAQGS